MTDDLLEEEPTTKKKRQRVHFSRIRSIGAVFAGDNPEADILFWKSHDQGPMASGPAARAVELGRASGSGPRPLSAAQSVAVQKRLDAIDRKIQSMKGRRMRKTDQQSSEQILARVDAMATEIRKSAGSTPAQARAEVWRTHPELKTEIRKAQARERDAGKHLAADIDAQIKSYALSISTRPEYMGKTLSQIRGDLMKSAAGIEVRKLRDAARSGEVSTETEIRKSADHADAWNILKGWEAERTVQ